MNGRRSLFVAGALILLIGLLSGCDLGQPETPAIEGERPTPAPPTRRECPTYPPGWLPVTGTEVYPLPKLAEPAPRQWFADPSFGTCLVRVTDRAHDLSPEDTSTGMVNEYARVQAFNADGSRLLVRGTEGTWYLYDAHSLLPLGELPLAVEPRWDAEDPDLLYYTDGTRLISYHLQTAEQTEIHDFAADFPGQSLAAVWTRYEGSPSRDRRYWGLMAEDGSWLPIAFLVYDRQADQVAIRDVRGLPGIEEDVDHVTMSPLGTYLLASFDRACERDRLGDDAHPCGLMVYDRDLSRGRSLLRIIGHYDPALDAEGREVIVYQDIDTDQISMLDLETGTVTPLWEIDFGHTAIGLHFSGLAYERPGWAVVSTHDDDPATHTWMDDQVFAIELKRGGRVVRLAHTHSLVDDDQELDYWAEPHASANPDLTRILFSSNWGRSGTGEVEMFMIELPPDWPERLPPPAASTAPGAAPAVDRLTQLAPSGIARIWANEGGDKVTRDELRATDDPDSVLNSSWDGAAISLFGARNEVVAFNLVLEAPTGEAAGVGVSLASLAGPGGAAITTRPASGDELFNYVGRDIELFYVRYLEIRGLSVDLAYEGYDERHIPERCRRPHDGDGNPEPGTGWQDRPCHNRFYPDIAVPLELHSPFTIEAGTNQSIWGDIYIPRAAPAGDYAGTIEVAEGGTPTWQIPIRLHVHDFVLPDLPNARTMLFYSTDNINERYLGEEYPALGTPAYTQSLQLAERHFQAAHRHKISLIGEYVAPEQMGEVWTDPLSGELFTAARGYGGVGVGVGNNVYSIGTYGSWPWQDGSQAEMWANADAWVNWFDAQAFATPTDYFLYLIDESDDYAQIEQWSHWIDEDPGPGRRLMSMATIDLPTAARETPSLDIPASGSQFGLTEVWQNAADSYLADPARRFYIYNGHRPASGSFATEDEGVSLRELAWGQFKKGIDRWFYWEATYYVNYQCYGSDDPKAQTNLFQQAQTYGCYEQDDDSLGQAGWNYFNGDGVLLYPGTDLRYPEDSYGVMGPFASLRLKQWRRGIQDVDYLTLAAAINPARVAEIVDERVPEVLWEYGVSDPEDPTWLRADISWSTDPDDWEAARAELAGIIESASGDESTRVSPSPATVKTATHPPAPRPTVATSTADKWSLWTGGAKLRGANIYQRRVYPELDGPEFLGPGPVGPPYTQHDFDRLAAMGANYVNISHPGLFTETPPYVLDQDIQSNLDNLLSMIAQADMFAVITFRTGPGRSGFWAVWGEDTDSDPDEGWFDPSYYNNRVWGDQAAQDAWAAMWGYVAQRYRDDPIVVGYDLMCEPNSNEVGSYPLGPPLDVWDPEEFYAQYGGTLYDWNQFYPEITAAIRRVDAETPILIGGMAYSAVEWLPYLQPTGDPRTVYMVHQYAPHKYTHQEPGAADCSYPGLCDLDWDGEYDDPLDRAWLADLLSTVDDFALTHGATLAVNEFGAVRWTPGAAEFMDDEIDLFEQRGLNHALWVWDPAWEPWNGQVDAFNFRHGPDPDNHTDVASSDLMDAITGYWGRNTLRPSTPPATIYLPIVLAAAGVAPEPMPLEEVSHIRAEGKRSENKSLSMATSSPLEIRPYESKDHAQVVALWSDVFKDDPPWNEPANREVIAFYRSLGYELEERASLGKRLGAA